VNHAAVRIAPPQHAKPFLVCLKLDFLQVHADTLAVLDPLKDGDVVTYLLFCTEVPTRSKKMPDLHRVVSAKSMGAAISEACKLVGDGVIVWKIRGSDGFVMERRDIETERLRRTGD
jgi:hypothetical protein